MQAGKRKQPFLIILIGAVLAAFLGYLAGGAWQEGITFTVFLERFRAACAAPFAGYYNAYTGKAVMAALGAYLEEAGAALDLPAEELLLVYVPAP